MFFEELLRDCLMDKMTTRRSDMNENSHYPQITLTLINKNIIGIAASSQLSVDVESIIHQMYLYCHRYTMKMTNLKHFCEEAEIKYKKYWRIPQLDDFR